MDIQWWWWIAVLIVVGLELTTGTVYLLMIALGLFAAGLAACFGYGFTAQIVTAALVSATGCLLVKRGNFAKQVQLHAQSNQDVQIDVGNRVTVDAWQPDGTANVQYRGAQWLAQLEAGQAAHAGSHSIVAMQGNTLVLVRVAT